jgi:chromosome segregation ATPase
MKGGYKMLNLVTLRKNLSKKQDQLQRTISNIANTEEDIAELKTRLNALETKLSKYLDTREKLKCEIADINSSIESLSSCIPDLTTNDIKDFADYASKRGIEREDIDFFESLIEGGTLSEAK